MIRDRRTKTDKKQTDKEYQRQTKRDTRQTDKE